MASATRNLLVSAKQLNYERMSYLAQQFHLSTLHPADGLNLLDCHLLPISISSKHYSAKGPSTNFLHGFVLLRRSWPGWSRVTFFLLSGRRHHILLARLIRHVRRISLWLSLTTYLRLWLWQLSFAHSHSVPRCCHLRLDHDAQQRQSRPFQWNSHAARIKASCLHNSGSWSNAFNFWWFCILQFDPALLQRLPGSAQHAHVHWFQSKKLQRLRSLARDLQQCTAGKCTNGTNGAFGIRPSCLASLQFLQATIGAIDDSDCHVRHKQLVCAIIVMTHCVQSGSGHSSRLASQALQILRVRSRNDAEIFGDGAIISKQTRATGHRQAPLYNPLLLHNA
mmetsp:Transcript_45381/g.105288  ORF Transcript_45381/g.105288 Transcript_45381/m.105288 type:complete len:337 (-) Transcript_45381:7-1017(-)